MSGKAPTIELTAPIAPASWFHLHTWATIFKLRKVKELRKVKITLGETEKARRNVALVESFWKQELELQKEGKG